MPKKKTSAQQRDDSRDDTNASSKPESKDVDTDPSREQRGQLGQNNSKREESRRQRSGGRSSAGSTSSDGKVKRKADGSNHVAAARQRVGNRDSVRRDQRVERTSATPESKTETAEKSSSSNDGCVVVGVGASAGGLESFKKLLRSLPVDAGIAYVLIQHLDPTHESLMVELLSKYTAMPVLQVQRGMRIEANHVYMIPPNHFIKIHDGGLYLDQPVTHRGVRLPIDYFFRSLAEAHRERAICVVLSGTGSDGADGIREVKAAGGMTIVQHPETAQYDGMPRSALHTGAVDYRLPIEEMPEVIVRYARHPYVQSSRALTLAETSPEHFRAILSLLRAYTDHDFSRYKTGTLTRRIDRRMGILHIDDPGDYLGRLRQDSNELQALFRDLLIGVTRFFRNAEAWEELTRLLAVATANKQEDEPFRVWVPGCSSGEEAYTVAAILFDQQQIQQRRLQIQVFATDIDADAIRVARSGIYNDNATTDIPDRYLDAFFQREGDDLRVRKRLRESCVFAVQNLLSDPPFSHLDLVCCRNLLIYLKADVQQTVFEMFHYALKQDGLLLLGNSESPVKQKQLFETVNAPARIFRKVQRDEHQPAAGMPLKSKQPRNNREDAALDGRTPEMMVGTAELSKRALLEEYAPASVVVDDRGLIQFIHGPVRNYLDFPSGEPDLEVASMALDGLKSKVRTALHRARTSRETVSLSANRVRRGDATVTVRLRVHPLPSPRRTGTLYLVSFFDEMSVQDGQPARPEQAVADDADATDIGEAESREQDARHRELAAELQATREDLQSTIEELGSANEELKASNEEVMSMNEELQSTNEELETSREELQMLNEELSTVNSQLHDKVDELEATTDDLTNLLTSTEMATLFLDEELRIRRYTPATSDVMNILPSDIGRPVSDLSVCVNDQHLVRDARLVLERLMPLEQEVHNGGEKWYMRRVMPFRTGDNKIQGVVVTYADISTTKRSEQRLQIRERQQGAVAQLGRSALAGEDLNQLFDQAIRLVSETLKADLCKVLRVEPGRKRLKLVAGVGWDKGLVGNATVSSGIQSQAGYTLQSSGPVVVKDLRTEKRFSGPALLTEHDVISGLSVPIGPEDEPWGVLGAHTRELVEFNVDDANFVYSVANVLWLAIRRRLTETELQDNQTRTAAFLNNSALVAWMKNEQGAYTWVSENFRRVFHLEDDDCIGKTDKDLWDPETASQFRANDHDVLQSQHAKETVETAAYPDGSQGKFLSLKFPFDDSSGKRFVGGLAVDITARLDAERALAESEERLRLAAQMAGFGTFYYDLQSDHVSWSPELRAILGVAPDAPLPCSVEELSDFVHSEDRERMLADIRSSLAPQGDKAFDNEYRVLDSDGQIRWLLVQGRTVFEGEGQAVHAVRLAGVALDITDRHRVQDELIEARHHAEAANEAKSTFLANMSHEIRTPMTAILGYADVLHAKVENPEMLACVRTIKENGAYLCEILNDILDLSKIESGKLDVRREPCSLFAILADVKSLMAVPATEKSLTLSVEFESEVPDTIVSDSKFVRQVLVNLVGNAIKFTSEGGVRIVAGCEPQQETVTFTVIDTGIGIDEEDLQKLFVPFEQVDNSFTRKTGGTGLGLAISRELAKKLGGDLKVESQVGKGSQFRFTFATGPLDDTPLQKPDPDTLREILERVEADKLPQINGRILAADDRREIRFLVSEFIESAGGEIVSVDDGAAAVEAFLKARETGQMFDAVLMDIQMPVMDGLEATAKLRAEGFRGAIIALTANVMTRDRERCLAAGCDDLIAKPIDRGLLIRRLADLMHRSDPSGDIDSISILCVDDDRAMRHMHKNLLEKRGFVVATAASAQETLSLAEDFVPDVALIDLGLGRVSGGQLLSQLKTKPSFANCVFICLSGRSDEESNWRELGFDEFLQKPTGVEQIERVIRQRMRR